MLKAKPIMTMKSVSKSNRKLSRNVNPYDKSHSPQVPPTHYSQPAPEGRDSEKRRTRGLPVYVPHELKGFYMVRGRKGGRGERPHCARGGSR